MKNQKLPYYLKSAWRYLLPPQIMRNRLQAIFATLEQYDADYVFDRVNYYNKLRHPFPPNPTFTTIKAFKKAKKKTYFFDMYEYLRYFDEHFMFHYLFGDITQVPLTPTILKSRPIDGNNANSVLMNLNKIRHFVFLEDPLEFSEKKSMAVWRGGAYQPQRIRFVKEYYDHPLCDVGQTNKPKEEVPWQKPKLSIREQLDYKFIFSIEGNDVATNLKWIMSSNSLAFMPKPKFETWFMEGRLIPDYHYVLLKDDLSDVEAKIAYYTEHPDKALEIISHANQYVAQFMDQKREDLISLLVLKKYFEHSGQL